MTDPNHPAYKVYNGVLQFSILFFTLALVYFAFVYYPRVINEFKRGNVPASQPVFTPVIATAEDFPIQTNNYRMVYESGSDTYYVHVAGSTLDKYMLNVNSAQLTLKNILVAESLCGYNIVVVSAENIEVPEQYRGLPSCR